MMVDFQIVNERRKRACAAEIIDFERVNGRQLRVSASKIFDLQIVNERQSRVSASEVVDFEEEFAALRISFTPSLLGCRVGSGRSCRVGRRFDFSTSS